jgi:hypothetical protein
LIVEKACKDRKNFASKILYYDRARDAFGDILDALKIGNKDVVMLPSYIGWSTNEGSGVFDPINKRNLKLIFYKMYSNFNIDIEKIVSKNDNIKNILK